MPSALFLRISTIAWAALAVESSAGPAALPESVRASGSLRTARAGHSATTLNSGMVLIAGGMSGGGSALSSAELFDPATNVVKVPGGMSDARVSHTATLLRDGGVLIAGGYNGDYLAALELFDPTTKRFRRAGSLREGRSGHTATVLADGRVLLVGGVGKGWTFLRTAELYDPATGRSEHVGPMNVAREGHTATLLNDGRVLVVGGHSGRRATMRVYADAEIYSPRTRRFESTGSLRTPRHKHDAVKMADGRVLVIGGADRTDRVHFATTEVFDPGTGSFAAGPRMANRRYKIAGTSVLLPSGDVLVTSGARDVERLDIRSWRFGGVPGSLPAAYRFAAAAALPGGDVVFAGGYSDDNENTAGIWRFHRRLLSERE